MQIQPSNSGGTGPDTASGATAGTVQQQNQPTGFPPFKTDTYPAQFFWLFVTFSILLIVMWRIAVPRIGGAIGLRRAQIDGDLATAEAHRRAAEQAAADYETALSAARKKAHGLAEENRQRVQADIDAAKAKAEAETMAATKDAEARIAASRDAALAHVQDAARDASQEIVRRLTGDDVPAEEAAAAVGAALRR